MVRACLLAAVAGWAPRSLSVLHRIFSFFEVCLRAAFVFCVLPVLPITKMNSTQARTCGVAFWNTRQPIHARRRKRVWETSGLAHHQGWLVENLTAGAHQRRMASVSSEKRAAESHLVAVFKKHKETTVTGIATRRSFHLGALHGLPYRVEFRASETAGITP
ncbi:uncharacterized protein LOC119181551 isoform X10 [Rhipicephalus microplus]|uniref:uncharacterized protein LOC119181551 isoform X10 n=1 Tax=Rhipicephalus microplus TaxID=6941 RepID=UPI003F6CB2FC